MAYNYDYSRNVRHCMTCTRDIPDDQKWGCDPCGFNWLCSDCFTMWHGPDGVECQERNDEGLD